MTLLDMVRDYQSLLEHKEELADEVKANNALIEEAKANISQQMIDDDCPSISVGGFKFTLTPKTIYNKKSEAELASEGINFFETLREEGLGDIIVESVNTRTLQSTIKAYIEENDGLSEDLATSPSASASSTPTTSPAAVRAAGPPREERNNGKPELPADRDGSAHQSPAGRGLQGGQRDR